MDNHWMRPALSLAVVTVSLYLIAAPDQGEPQRQWAIGAIAFVMGYYLRGPMVRRPDEGAILDLAMETETHPQPAEIVLHAIVYQKGGNWLGTCLERCIPSQARTREALVGDLERMIRGYLRLAEREGAEPFAQLPRASRRDWDQYRDGSAERLEFVIHLDAAASPAVELRAA
jgi:hypothetical protein